MDTIWYS